MRVSEGMTTRLVTVGPGHTLREAAAKMIARNVGAAVVVDPDGEGYAILTERDLLHSMGRGEDLDTERTAAHLSADIVCAAPDWSLEQAAAEMVQRGFRHMIVIDHGEPVGILSMRDIVRCWMETGAVTGVPASARAS